MSRDDELVIGDTSVRFVAGENDAWRVIVGGSDVGSLDPDPDGGGYTARGADGAPLTRASQWGGRVTARFGSKELAVRALLSVPRP